MAFRLTPHERLDCEIKRVLNEEARAAAERLRVAVNGDGDEAIHEARKSVKKIRAVLRLVRRELGGLYREENARFREIGQKLSELRDAGAMVETADGLRKRYGDAIKPHDWQRLLRMLLKRKEEIEQEVDLKDRLEQYARELEDAAQDVTKWPLRGKGFALIAPGFEEAFRRGREAMDAAQQDSAAENFHEWRKRVKDHWYHVRLLTGVWKDMMGAYADVLKGVQVWLGDDHNLAVLRELIENTGGEFDALVPVIERHQAGLREQAFIAGVRVYREKPERLRRRTKFLWNAPAEKQDVLKEL